MIPDLIYLSIICPLLLVPADFILPPPDCIFALLLSICAADILGLLFIILFIWSCCYLTRIWSFSCSRWYIVPRIVRINMQMRYGMYIWNNCAFVIAILPFLYFLFLRGCTSKRIEPAMVQMKPPKKAVTRIAMYSLTFVAIMKPMAKQVNSVTV